MPIHHTAIISKEASIDESTDIGPYVIIEGKVEIGKNNRIMAGAYIGHGTTIGEGNEIHMGAIVGHIPQDKSYKNEETFLHVGNYNIIREYVTIHKGSASGSSTIIGDSCLIMGGCHIAHDCKLGSHIIMANMSGMAGYVEVGDRAFISGGAMIHQFVKIGRLALLSGNSRMSMDIPPFVIAAERNQVWGINVIGLRRAGLASKTINELRELYRVFFKSNTPRMQLLKNLREHPFSSEEVEEFLTFVENSKRGVCRSSSEKAM